MMGTMEELEETLTQRELELADATAAATEASAQPLLDEVRPLVVPQL